MLFATEYVKDLSATRAAIRAGYSAKTAKQAGSRLLTKVDVKAEVRRLMARVTDANEITAERTMREIARIAYGDIRTLYSEDGQLKPIHTLDEAQAAMIGGLEVEEVRVGDGDDGPSETQITRKVKIRDKLNALEKCMAMLGMHKSVNPAAVGGLNLTIQMSGKSAR